MSGRPSAKPPMRVRVPRALREFVLLPMLVVFGLLLLGVASIVGDQAHGAFFSSLREVLGHVIGPQAATSALSAIATGLVTVTSITFSVLLLAVQQTASNLSPVVFDQFVRRRTNQVYLGLFVGLALYSYVVMAAVQPKTPPIIGAFLATCLTVVALGCLLFLVYSTIAQMRPDNVMRQLHDRAARAHDREGHLVRRCRRTSISSQPVLAEYHADTFGYVESVDLDQIAQELRRQGEGSEVEICRYVGEEVMVGTLIARIRHHDRSVARSVCAAVARAVPISPAPDLDYDPRTAVHNISNIGWTSGSTSKHNPEIAAKALHALGDLASRWMTEGDRSATEPLPVVYPDGDVETVLDCLYSAIVVARESRQHQQAVRVLRTYAFLFPRSVGRTKARIRRDIEAMQPILDEMPPSPRLAAERSRLCDLVGLEEQVGCRVGQ